MYCKGRGGGLGGLIHTYTRLFAGVCFLKWEREEKIHPDWKKRRTKQRVTPQERWRSGLLAGERAARCSSKQWKEGIHCELLNYTWRMEDDLKKTTLQVTGCSNCSCLKDKRSLSWEAPTSDLKSVFMQIQLKQQNRCEISCSCSGWRDDTLTRQRSIACCWRHLQHPDTS